MSNKATLQELYDVCINLVDEDNLTDFTLLANRSVKRLYSKAATPSDTVLYHMTITTTPWVDDPVSHVHMPLYSVVVPSEYSHAKMFKVSEGFDSNHSRDFNFTPSGESNAIIPMESTFNNSGYDYDAFVDYGEIGGERVYGLPNWLNDQLKNNETDYSVWGLLRKAYTPVSAAGDLLPFESTPAMKLAVLGTVYEDDNDLERGELYWAKAIQELESESQTYRGPQKLNISFRDEAAYDVVETMN